ncbi:MAG: TonB family protein [Calditrichaceae bacterium]|nr:TonB family protein [Calditrichia bacterium]NUQ42233.1 TonB family protein [Calditrichaceae bacterium]
MKAFGFFCSMFLPVMLAAQVTVSGEITRNTRWFGQVFVDGDVVVAKGVTLSIEPGSRIVFRANQDKTKSGNDPSKIEFIVLGKLIAAGEQGDGQIVFTSDATGGKAGSWHGLIFKNLTVASIMRYCIVEYAYKGVTCYGSSPEINGCEIRFNQYAGISCEVRSAATIRNCSIMGNDFAGLVCELGSSPLLEKTVITQNTNGVIVFDRSRPDLGRSEPGAGESRGENQVYGNFETDIYNRSTLDLFAQNNLWNSERATEIQKKIIDKEKNSSYGKVIFEPLFGRRTPPLAARQVPQPSPPLSAPQNSANAQPLAAAGNPGQAIAGSDGNPAIILSTAASQPDLPLTEPPLEDSNPAQPPDTAAQTLPDQTSIVTPETLIVYREIFVEKPASNSEPVLTDPVLERQLDSGKRSYVNLAKPEYPEIYKRTRYQGRVIMEVIVDYDGEVESYSVVRSEGDYFTGAAIDALKKMRYRPETFQGRPVKFKIYESFVFKLDQTE